MDAIFQYNGHLKSITVEKADVFKSGLSWKEDIRRFYGRIIFNEKHHIAEKQTDSERELFEYNDKDQLIRSIRLSIENESVLTETIWEYDNKGQSLKKESKDKSGKTKKIFFEHDNSNRLIAEKSDSGILVKKFTRDGLLESEYRYTGNNPDLIKEFTYNPEKQLIAIIYKSAQGEIIRKEEFSYTDQGFLQSEKTINSGKAIITNTLYEYDDFHKGNWLKRTRYSVIEDSKKIREIPVEIIYRSITESRDFRENTEKPVKGGKLEFPNGTYNGEIKDGVMDGKGIFCYHDGNHYEGSFRKGLMHGKGCFRWADGKEYSGDFVDGVMDGRGICTWPNGDRYEGEFSDGMMHGIGKFSWSSGDEFQGLFDKNHRTDQGMVETAEEKEYTK